MSTIEKEARDNALGPGTLRFIDMLTSDVGKQFPSVYSDSGDAEGKGRFMLGNSSTTPPITPLDSLRTLLKALTNAPAADRAELDRKFGALADSFERNIPFFKSLSAA
ncbi:MAG TPA: hypothetical protein VG934_00525 [Candidatus Paceibacterota bacterium]|nr:hypothetical protein [Candidatus Paceibacterota bacterium]